MLLRYLKKIFYNSVAELRVINNYYVSNDDEDVFVSLLEAVDNDFLGEERDVEAVVQKPHESYFRTHGFEIERAWSLYLKMRKKHENE